MALDRKNVNLTQTMVALQAITTTKGADDKFIHPKMDMAYNECKTQDKNEELLPTLIRRMMLHIGDVSRQHHILEKFGIKSKTGGAQERVNFRSLMRWWEKNMPDSFYSDKTLEAIYEFTVAENLFYNEIRTDRDKGTFLGWEIMDFNKEKIVKFIAKMIKSGKNIELWAKHLPKIETGEVRITKKTIKVRKAILDKGVDHYRWPLPFKADWVKVNGVLVNIKECPTNKEGKPVVVVRNNDVVSYPRKKQPKTIERQKRDYELIFALSKELNLETIERKDTKGETFIDFIGYKKLRQKQNTAQQKICSKEILNYSKAEFFELMDKKATAATQFRIAKMIAYKDEHKNLVPKEGIWKRLGEYYIEWVSKETVVVEKLREAASRDDVGAKAQLMKELKTKTVGIQTIDMLSELFLSNLTDSQINNTHQALLERMDLIANVFVVADMSGSMDRTLQSMGVLKTTDAQKKYGHLKLIDVCAAITITFSTRNPVQEFRNTYAAFSRNVMIMGNSNFIDERPNAYVSRQAFTRKVDQTSILSETKSFTENLRSFMINKPNIAESTNMFAIIEYFVKLVKDGKFTVEQLPNVLLYVTDNENNTGLGPKAAIALAAEIGWYPLQIFWGLCMNDMQYFYDTEPKTGKKIPLPNTLFVGGFEESRLSQILRGIKSGSVNPQDELWAIHDDPRYSVID